MPADVEKADDKNEVVEAKLFGGGFGVYRPEGLGFTLVSILSGLL